MADIIENNNELKEVVVETPGGVETPNGVETPEVVETSKEVETSNEVNKTPDEVNEMPRVIEKIVEEQNVIVEVPVVEPVLNNLDKVASDLVIQVINAVENKSVNVNNLPTFIFHIMNLVQNVGNLSGVEKKQVVLKVLETVATKYNVDIDWLLVSNMIDFSVSVATQQLKLGTDDVKKGCLSCLKVLFSKKN